MDATPIIGTLAAVLTTAANLPQAYSIIRKKSAKDIAAGTYVLLFLGTALWTVYGSIRTDWPIITCNGIAALSSGIILILKGISQRRLEKIHQSVMPKARKKNP